MKTVKDLFILDTMKQCEVLAGNKGLNRLVKNVNISDTPDVIHYLEKNQILLTTGYGFYNNTQKLCDLIKQMNDLNCAGMIIKVDRFLKILPKEALDLAESLSFPIINSPSDQTLGNMSRHILNYLNDDETEKLYYALHVQKEFSKMMLEEYSVESLVEQLSLYINRPVLLLNHRGVERTESSQFQSTRIKKQKQQIIDIIKQNLSAARNGFSYHNQLSNIPIFTTFPVKTKNRHPSILAILNSSTLPYPSTQLAVEQASNVISFTLIKSQAIDENIRILKNNFFSDLIENKIESKREIKNRANYYGLEYEKTSICITCTVDINKDNYLDENHLYERRVGIYHHQINDQMEDALAKRNLNATVFTKGKYFVIVVQFPLYTETEVNTVVELLKEVQSSEEDYTLSFGISSPIQTLSELNKAYQEALEAIVQGYSLFKNSFIYFYKTKELKELFRTIPIKDLRSLYENTLKSLAYPTGEYKDLVHTIEVYLDHQCEITSTSSALFVHRNTVKYRIKKAEEILGESLRDPVNSLRIRIALLIGHLLEEK